nr:MAG TPA: hypothetical protein [Caudoviricetes sp.]
MQLFKRLHIFLHWKVNIGQKWRIKYVYIVRGKKTMKDTKNLREVRV